MKIGLKIRIGMVWNFEFEVELRIKLRVLGLMIRGSWCLSLV